MFLQQEIENENTIIYIFRKDAGNISPVRAVALAILEFGDDPAGVPSSAINFAIVGHPHSGGQRFRELCAAYRREWPGVMRTAAMVDSHTYEGKKYFFSPLFMAWLRANLDEIEKTVYPVTVRRKLKD